MTISQPSRIAATLHIFALFFFLVVLSERILQDQRSCEWMRRNRPDGMAGLAVMVAILLDARVLVRRVYCPAKYSAAR